MFSYCYLIGRKTRLDTKHVYGFYCDGVQEIHRCIYQYNMTFNHVLLTNVSYWYWYVFVIVHESWLSDLF